MTANRSTRGFPSSAVEATGPRRERPRRRVAQVVFVTVAVLGLGACAPALPSPAPAPSVGSTPGPALSEDQADHVVTRIGAGLGSADASLKKSQLKDLLDGPALAIRRAQYQVAHATSADDALTVLPSTLQSRAVPTTQGWPRTAMAVTAQPKNLEAPRLLVLDQPSARMNYRLWAWVRLFPGVKMPAFSSVAKGSAEVTDSVGLAEKVPKVARAYADYLQRGGASKHHKEFRKDPLVTNIVERRTAMTKALKTIDGKYRYTFHVSKQPDVKALRTHDGGALAVVELSAVERAKGPKGSKVSPDAEARGLLGKKKASNSLTVKHTLVVAFAIPAQGSDDKVRVVGAENVPTSASVP